MPARVAAVRPGESQDAEVNRILQEQKEGWWNDWNMMGVIARRPECLKAMIPAFESFFIKGKVEPHIHELMRIKTGRVNDCTY